VFLQANIPFNSSPKPSVIKELNDDMLAAITQAVHVTCLHNIRAHLPPSIAACFFGSPTTCATSPRHKGNKNLSEATVDNNLETIFAEWKKSQTCQESELIPSVNETISLPAPREREEATRQASTAADTLFPPIAPSRGGIFSAVKGMFFKKRAAENVKPSSEDVAKLGEWYYRV
jgi:hypothetical protein